MGALVSDTRLLIQGSMSDEIAVLGSAYSPGSGLLNLSSTPRAIGPGAVLSSGLNVWYVLSVDTGGATLTVLGGHEGARDDALPSGAVVRVRPRITDYALFTEINRDIRALGSRGTGLFHPYVHEFGFEPTWETYPRPVEADGGWPVNIEYLVDGSPNTWRPQRGWRALPDGGVQLVGSSGGTRLRITYGMPFRPAPDLSFDLVAEGRMPEVMLEVLSLGAAASQLRTMEARRVQVTAQGDARNPTEVPMTGNTSVAREYMRIRQERLEAARLAVQQQFPPRRVGLA